MQRRGASRRGVRLRALATLVVVVAGWLWSVATPASAHFVGPTVILVTSVAGTDRPTLALDVQVPLPNLDFAYGTKLDADPVGAVTQRTDWLHALVADRIRLVSPDGAGWAVTINSLAGVPLTPENVLHAELTAVAPPGTRPDAVDLQWTVVSDVVFSDKAYVSGTSSAGAVDLAGVLTHQQPSLRLTVQAPATERVSFSRMLRIGANHFREGVDHQLFLCLLAIGAARRRAPLLVRTRRLALLTLSFTLGHSVSLAVATLGGVHPPTRLIESCIAATIVFAAAHALRPRLGTGTELILTVGFGLIHGFGFAGTLEDMSLRGAQLALPLLGFNLGLELAQLAAVALLAVPIWLISRSAPTTYAVTGAIGLIAVSWIVQRALGVANPLDRLVSAVFSTPERLALILLLVGLAHLWRRRIAPDAGR